MSGLILVSTHDLPRAGELREAFRAEGYEVDLVTPEEELSTEREPGLLVLTGGAAANPGEPLVEQAREMEVPMLAEVRGGDPNRVPLGGLDLLEVLSPDASADEVALVGRRIVERRRLQEITGIIGETDAIREALERVVQIAPVGSTVLVSGESGTGKELVARGIHALSPRRHKPFIAVNVAALSETLLESELFGHEKGSFTGAIDARKGLFELADKGTIFLDEIGEMPLATQTKLLRVLEQREFHRVGGEKVIRVDVRIIAATNQDLRQLVTTREFRKDLYYRLNVLSIRLPPLRERARDIPLLVRAFVREIGDRHERAFPGITQEAMEILQRYRWPGNVRELRNLVESMVVLRQGRKIGPADIPPEVRGEGRGTAIVPAAPPGRVSRTEDGSSLRPQLEFVFRTLVDLRVDMDDLRREFEAYRAEVGSRPDPHRLEVPYPVTGAYDVVEVGSPVGAREPIGDPGEERGTRESGLGEGVGGASDTESEGIVVFRPGMTMDDLEREAIAAALETVDGNRRRAAELLGIGERTLYRKLRKYDLEGKEGDEAS
jgi:DNA-binding NtrC family response regulator